jgi:hypothetical protein
MFNPGDKLFIRTVTFHHVGKVVDQGQADGFLQLESASWVADSGRFHTAIQEGELSEVEYVGEVFVNLAAIVDAFPWDHDLPTESK